ncbi:MAG: hypothetical protein HKN19_02850 [Halioglobus sp.]|nr:hypothetical protein [Halioglobus sp.]
MTERETKPDLEDLDRHPVAPNAAEQERIQVIDVGALLRDPESAAAAEAIDGIAAACRTCGFFQVINHGIEPGTISEVWRQTHAFFALPTQHKLAVQRSRENPWGFNNNELTKNQRDKKEVFDFTRENYDPIYARHNRWPTGLSGFQSTMTEYLESCAELSLKLLRGFCLGLDLPADYLAPQFQDNHTGFVRLNYYPVHDPMAGLDLEKQPVADLGIHHHTDAGALTVLLQDEFEGLQVYRNGYWHDVPVIPGALVINTGDMMQVWSNDTYRAAIHRVRAMHENARYSIPFFFNPAADCSVSPLPTMVEAAGEGRYRPIVWGDYRGKRSDGDYADYGDEVQIAQYRT